MHDVAWRGMWICVRSKDAQKQLARTSLRVNCYLECKGLQLAKVRGVGDGRVTYHGPTSF